MSTHQSGTSHQDVGPAFTVLAGAEVYTPDYVGQASVVIYGDRIVSIDERLPDLGGLSHTVVDRQGCNILPGFMDNHVHLAGGGGGCGFTSRSHPLKAIDFATSGITTIVGMLGFDATTRLPEVLLAEIKSLREEGMGAYALTGSTREHPVPTLTGSARTDIAFVEEYIGAGEISLSEIGYGYDSYGQGSYGAPYVARLASETLLAGRLSGKGGYVCLQVPPYGNQTLEPLFTIIERTGLPRSLFLPSHANQSRSYLDHAVTWGVDGGWVDVGSGYRPDRGFDRAIDTWEAVGELLESGVPAESITISSDGNGVVPLEGKKDVPTEAVLMTVGTLMEVWRQLVEKGVLPIQEATKLVTSNVADVAHLEGRGRLTPGGFADLAIFDDNWSLQDVYAGGKVMVSSGNAAQVSSLGRV